MSVEIEFKFRVADEAALALLEGKAGGKKMHTVEQCNVFLDTQASSLDAARLILRLRREGEVGAKPRYFLTAKGPGTKSHDGMLSKKAEEEIQLTSSEGEALLAGTHHETAIEILATPPCSPARQNLLAKIDDARQGETLLAIGAFNNIRTRVLCSLPTGDEVNDAIELLLEFDRTSFPNEQHHFEVEVEVAEEDTHRASLAMRRLLKKSGVEARSASGKAKRFFQALRGENID